MSVRVTFRPNCTNLSHVNYDAHTFRIEADESISLLDEDEGIIGSVHSGVWEDVILNEETVYEELA